MTRKDFVLIAQAVWSSRLDDNAKMVIASELAASLAPTNPRFEAGRFIRACTRGEGI